MAESKTELSPDAAMKVLSAILLNPQLHEPDRNDDDPEPTNEFCEVAMIAHDAMMNHLSVFEGMDPSFTPPKMEEYLHYWQIAPPHHFIADAGGHSLADLVWLTLATGHACANPKTMSTKGCTRENGLFMMKELQRFRDHWPLGQLPEEKVYVAMRDRFIAMAVFIVSHGAEELISSGVLKTWVENESKEEVKADPSGVIDRVTPEGKIASRLGDTVKVVGDEKGELVIAMQQNMKFSEATDSMVNWVQRCVRVFPIVDAFMMLCRLYPIIPLEIKSEEEKADEKHFSRWMDQRMKLSTMEEFKRATLELACRLALPIGTASHHKRTATAASPSYESLFNIEFGDDMHARMDDLGMTKAEKAYTMVFDSMDRCRYMRDSLIINTYRQTFSNRTNKDYHWVEEYFVDSSSLQQSMEKILCAKDPRACFLVLHIADSYYLLNGVNLVRCANVTQALWWWGRCLETEFKSILPQGDHVKGRLTDYLRT